MGVVAEDRGGSRNFFNGDRTLPKEGLCYGLQGTRTAKVKSSSSADRELTGRGL